MDLMCEKLYEKLLKLIRNINILTKNMTILQAELPVSPFLIEKYRIHTGIS